MYCRNRQLQYATATFYLQLYATRLRFIAYWSLHTKYCFWERFLVSRKGVGLKEILCRWQWYSSTKYNSSKRFERDGCVGCMRQSHKYWSISFWSHPCWYKFSWNCNRPVQPIKIEANSGVTNADTKAHETAITMVTGSGSNLSQKKNWKSLK